MPILGGLSRLQGAGREALLPVAEAVGRFFRGIPAEEYFRTVKAPAKSVEEAKSLYGVDLRSDPRLGSLGANVPGGGRHWAETMPVSEFLRKYKEDYLMPEDIEALGFLHPKTPISHIDAMGTSAGVGGAPRTYGSILDLLSLTDEQPINVTSMLTPINTIRKPLNVADIMKRNSAVQDRFLPNVQMTQPLGMTPRDWMALNPDAQLGSMYLSGGLNALRRIQQQADLPNNMRRLLPGDEPFDFITRISERTSPEEFEAFRKAHGAAWGPGGVGADTLRKLQLMDAIVGGQTDRLPSGATRDIGLRRGGLAQCACGGHPDYD